MDCPHTVVSSGAPACPACGSTNVCRLDRGQDHEEFRTTVTSYRCRCGMGFTKMEWKEDRTRRILPAGLLFREPTE